MSKHTKSWPDSEECADEVFARVPHVRPPVDVEAIAASYRNLRITHHVLDNSGYLIDLGMHGGEILVSTADPPVRQRYTIAHELGHWCLQGAEDSTERRSHDLDPKAIERWCDTFAASLLIPRSWLLKDAGGLAFDDLPRVLVNLHSRYEVSRQALRRRVAAVLPISLIELRTRFGDVTVEAAYRHDRHSETMLREAVAYFTKIERAGTLYECAAVASFRSRAAITWVETSGNSRTGLMCIGSQP